MTRNVEALVIGAGPGGMEAALALKSSGIESILVIERENAPGGILMQCIHNGFGLHHFKEELTGPEYAERCLEAVKKTDIEVLVNTCALDIIDNGDTKKVIALSEENGMMDIEARVIILAMGCRERNRGNIAIPGSRPAGIMTAGLAQKMSNIYGYLPGKEIVILGSGDIGLIMARRLTWEGARVRAVIEAQPCPGGLNRNIVQCLNDFDIPLYLSHTITNIEGKNRIKKVYVSPIDAEFNPLAKGSFTLECDCLLLSIGLIPENELSLKAGIIMDPVTKGALVNADLMTSVNGVFACGNVLHVHDLVDYVSEESKYCGTRAAMYVKGELKKGREIPVKAGNMVRYLLPRKVRPGEQMLLSLRCIVPMVNASLVIKTDKDVIYTKKYRKIFPSEMQRLPVENIPGDAEYLEVFFDNKKPVAGV